MKTTPALRAKMRAEVLHDMEKLSGVLWLLEDIDELLSEPAADDSIVVLADWIERLLTPSTGETLEDRVREVAMEMIRMKQVLVDAKRASRDTSPRCQQTE